MSVGHGRAAIRALARRPRLWIWTALAIVLGIGLGQLPLFGVLGYELSLVTAVFAAIMGLDVGSALAREIQRAPTRGIERSAYPGRMLWRSTVSAAGLALAVTLIPAAICAVRGIWTPTCDWGFGVESFVAMPAMTAVLAGALGHALGVACGPRRFVGAAVAQVPLVLVIAWAGWRFYAAPPVFSYNAILGYFPGNLYDENVQLGMALAWSRLEEVCAVVAIVAVVATRLDVPSYRVRLGAPRPRSGRISGVLIAAVFAAIAIGMHLDGGELGYAIAASDIEDALGGELETAHFVIHYAHTKDIDADIALIADDHEFRYSQVVAQLGVAPTHKIHSFYFADSDHKGRWMGARDVEMAKPWRQEIYLDHRAFPHTSLRHEIAHAVASEFGDPLFGVAARPIAGLPVLVNPGLIEGLAVAIDWPGAYDRPTPHEAVRAMQAMGMQPSIDELLSVRFFEVSSARGYTTAGSFLRFLLDTYGPAKLRAVYGNGGDFDAAYGTSRDALEREWRTMIGAIVLPPAAVEASRERFRGGSVFSRPCPHAIAARRERAFEAYGAGDRARAVTLMRHVCGDAPDEPRNRIQLADMLVSGDPVERAEAVATWTALATDADHVTSTVRADAYERLAREAAARGDLDRVRALIAEAVKLPVDSNERRQLDAEAIALAHPGDAAAALRNYFFGVAHGPDPASWALLATLAEPGLGFAHYLLGLQRASAGEWQTAAGELARAIALGLPGIAFVKNAARKLALAAFRVHDQAGLELAIATLSGPEMATVDRLFAEDWRQRAAFAATSR